MTNNSKTDKTAADMAKETQDAAKNRAETLRHRAEETARDAWATGKAEATAHVETAQETAASETERTAGAFRDAAEDFAEGDYRRLAADQLADGIDSVANTIRNKDLGDIPGDLRQFARKNPVAFYAGAALLGFAVSRLAKATERSQDGDYLEYDDDYDVDNYSDSTAQARGARQMMPDQTRPAPVQPSVAYGEGSGYAASASREQGVGDGFDTLQASGRSGGSF